MLRHCLLGISSNGGLVVCIVRLPVDWLVEQGLASHSTQFRSFWRQVRWPNQQCQSIEGGWLVIQIALSLTRLISPCYNNTTCMHIQDNDTQRNLSTVSEQSMTVVRSEIFSANSRRIVLLIFFRNFSLSNLCGRLYRAPQGPRHSPSSRRNDIKTCRVKPLSA